MTAGTANPALGFATGVWQLGAVSVSEVKTVVEAAIPSVEVTAGVGGVIELRMLGTGAAVSLPVQPATAVAFGFDSDLHSGSNSGAADAVRVEGKDPGAYADSNPSRGPRRHQRGSRGLLIEDGVYRETFPNLSMDPSQARSIEAIVNDEQIGSNLIRAPGRVIRCQMCRPCSSPGQRWLDDSDSVGSEAGSTLSSRCRP